jgi:PDZ domain-containing protein
VWFGGQPPRTPRERARARAIRRGVLFGLGVVVIGSVVKLPLLIESPGPTYNTIGEVDGQPMIVITGTRTFPTDGNLDMTTVSVRGGNTGGVYLGEALLSWALPTGAVVPRESVYGPDIDPDEIEQRNDQLFALSQSDSIAAAMGELGIPTEQSVVVTVVGGGTPADGIVEAGDVIVAVDGTEVAEPADVGDVVRGHQVGDTVVLDVLRTGEPGTQPTRERLEVVTAANPDLAAENPDAPPVPYIGIVVSTQFEAPFEIDFTLDNVGGPSAGMMFSLAIVDMLTEGPITSGGHVAGTGTITPEGVVGPIGGIRQKLVGARDAGAGLFLAPRGNCDEVTGNEPDGMAVVPVGTLAEARDIVERWADDPASPFPTCLPGLEARQG